MKDPHDAPDSARPEGMHPSEFEALTYLTRELRCGKAPIWERLRTRLAEEGVLPDDAAIAYMLQDDVNFELRT